MTGTTAQAAFGQGADWGGRVEQSSRRRESVGVSGRRQLLRTSGNVPMRRPRSVEASHPPPRRSNPRIGTRGRNDWTSTLATAARPCRTCSSGVHQTTPPSPPCQSSPAHAVCPSSPPHPVRDIPSLQRSIPAICGTQHCNLASNTKTGMEAVLTLTLVRLCVRLRPGMVGVRASARAGMF